MKIIGVDPGIRGAIVVIDNDQIIHREQFIPIPADSKGWTKNKFNTEQAQEFISKFGSDAHYLAIETFPPMKAKTAVATLFHGMGIVEGIASVYNIEPVHILTTDWQKHYNLKGKPKKESIRVAGILYPFSIGKLLIKEADIAEAVLIAHYAEKYVIPMKT